MKNISESILVCVLLLSQVLMLPTHAAGNAGDTAFLSETADGIIAYKIEASGAKSIQNWLDTDLTDGAGTFSEWYVIALCRYIPGLDTSSYTSALGAYLDKGTAGATARQRCALALSLCGNNGCSSTVVDSTVGEQGIMSIVFGLHLLNNGVHSDKYSADDLTEMLTGLALEGGGWALFGNVPDTDVTAMTVQALSPYISSDTQVKKSVDDALDILGEKQLASGGYMSYGSENPESCAQTIIALASVGIDPESDSRFIKNGKTLLDAMMSYRLPNGSFSHTAGGETNDTSTSQALCALVALKQLREGLSPLYILDGAERPPYDSADDCESVANTVKGEESTSKSGYKIWVCLAVAATVLILCFIVFINKKRRLKNYIVIVLSGAAVAAVVLLTDINLPDGYYNGDEAQLSDRIGSVTLSIRCDTVAGATDADYIPKDGVILDNVTIDIASGDTVYDVLIRAAREYNIQIDKTGFGTGIYISGINYLYELAFGGMSGWVYRVNGVSQSVGCGACVLSDNDRIEWLYTLELGSDVE